jgi:hypothetical protein
MKSQVKYGGVDHLVIAQMTRAQAMRLKNLADETYQPHQFERGISQAEAERRIAALKAEVELADSF